jgi:hypothetical protein
MKKRSIIQNPLRIISEKVVSRSNPDEIIGSRPEDFPQLSNTCKLIAATIETGKEYRLVGKSN